MRGGYPIHLCFSETRYRGVLTRTVWFVDAGFAGRCGHSHETEEDARKCVEPMEKKWREKRWPKRKKATN